MAYIDELQKQINDTPLIVRMLIDKVIRIDKISEANFDTSNERYAMMCREVSKLMKLHDNETAKRVRHQAAEIALSVGGERDANEAHRDIMNLKFELK